MPSSMNYSLKMANKTSRLQQWLENIWYNKGNGKYLLLPLAGLYCVVNQLQRLLQSHHLPKITCPVIVVGNITIGGTGKTPLAIYLVKHLQQAGYHPAIITRGYGGKATQWPQAVSAESDAQMVGDEAVLMAVRTGVPVYAGANRLESIEACLKHSNYNCDVIISDDGMQHYKMPRDIEIVVIDGERKLGNGLCLPAGPLRERQSRLNNCDFIVVNGKKESIAHQHNWVEMRIKGDRLINLKTRKTIPVSDLSAQTVNAVTGIGNPQRFYKTLEKAGLILNKHSFPDHYSFEQKDLVFSHDLPILMTEKDAVKCKLFASDNCWYLPVEAQLDDEFDTNFLKLLGYNTT